MRKVINTMKNKVLLLVTLCGIMSLNTNFAKAQQRPKLKVHLFPLSSVRLLPSIFKKREKADEHYMMSLNVNRLLAPYFKTAGIKPKAPQYGGWESTQLAGAFGGQYLEGLSEMFAATGDKELKQRIDYMVDQLAIAQKKLGTGYIGGIPKGLELWKKIAAGDIHAQSFSLDSVWSPWYNLHMMYRGLYNAWRYAGNQQARKVMIRFGDWAVHLSNQLSDKQFARMIQTEYSGMNAIMADLYSMTGKKKFLKLAKRFNDKRFFAPLAAGVDSLAGHHVNKNIPKIIGAAREYEIDGNPRMAKIAKYFFKEVTGKRIYINGEMGYGEYFHKLGSLPNHLDKDAGETGNVYNMLILTQHLMEWNPDNMSYIRYYERALYNDILASIDPKTGMMCYYLSMKPGFFKTFGTPYNSFWCCYGTGVQNHAKYGKVIYMHNEKDLYVNLFIPSVLHWKQKGITLTQKTEFPKSKHSTLQLKMKHPHKLTLKIRHPWWAHQGFEIKINGHKIQQTGSAGSYVTITRMWHNGDTISLSLPMKLHVEHMQLDHQKAAIMYGPVVLAGELGGYVPFPYAKGQRDLFYLPTVAVPSLAAKNQPPTDWIKPVKCKPLHFKTVGAGRPHDVELAPLYQITHQHYTVYWNLVTDNELVQK